MKKEINNDEEILYLDVKEIEYFINNTNKLSFEQLLLLWNKSLKMKFDEQTIQKLIKRIIGLPGEKIEYKNGMLYVNDEYMVDPFAYDTYDFSTLVLGDSIPEDKYLVLGDNRGNSIDSRMIGLIDKNDIEGKTSIRFYPLDKIGKVE